MNQEEENKLKGNSDENFDEILRISSRLKVPSSALGKEAAWEKLMQSIEENNVEEVKVVPLFASRKLWYSVAASLIILFTITSLTYRYSMVEFQLSKGQTANLFLPDSSNVMLNSDSKIEYRRFGWLANRNVKLKGEAYFSVKHGSRFTVLTEYDRKIIVTGTKFNVLSRGNQFEVKCFDGSVAVKTSSSNTVSLIKGNGIELNRIDESPLQITLDSIAEPTWIKGEYYFNDIPLNLVLDELSRQFNVSIKAESINTESKNYTGFFKRNRLVQALDLICIPMELTYHISSDSTSVTIKK